MEAEHYHDEVGLLIGSVFVLGQAAITQTVSILSELRKHGCSERHIPCRKEDRMIQNADLEPSTNLSKIVIINAVANYFKHLYGWPENWDTESSNGHQENTISVARTIGMKPGDRTDNLLLARTLLEIKSSSSPSSPARAIPDTIQAWREAWAAKLYQVFELSDPLAECRKS